jgi:hypothetical protein
LIKRYFDCSVGSDTQLSSSDLPEPTAISMDQSSPWEACSQAGQEISCFLFDQGSLLCSQESATRPYTESF